MIIEKHILQLEDNLKQHIKHLFPKHNFSQIYHYALFPPGKLFRPQLAVATAKDLSPADTSFAELMEIQHPVALLASALELHHVYTLLHDDLPCMDNDDWRRDKLATHKKYGEWQALLAGDGLLNSSYQLLAKINHPNLGRLLKVTTWALGPKGLIQGQVLDLSASDKFDFIQLKKTHQLKTARLIQVAIIGSMLLTEDTNSSSLRPFLDLYKLGNGVGIVFQLLDDLSELEQDSISSHELAANGWINYPIESMDETLKTLSRVHQLLLRYQMKNLKITIGHYFELMRSKIEKSQDSITDHLVKTGNCKSFDLGPVVVALNRIQGH
ncbi:MAG: hypothetical protein HN353_01225 [Bdellovibrionales bacterium]|jgi:geranylgeranyl pyrophosphate synthase|nr:hypothetical protein [Bdellovibrionales bacterium]MBT3526708.1 hypothetical protein [Bdellovibrionales bacterium]MBT7670654.1 hypothetical protein [Bdellovibrionales bacterium]MBT7767905.1 hypothetical protein [Bdellovibrionales bacterium]